MEFGAVKLASGTLHTVDTMSKILWMLLLEIEAPVVFYAISTDPSAATRPNWLWIQRIMADEFFIAFGAASTTLAPLVMVRLPSDGAGVAIFT